MYGLLCRAAHVHQGPVHSISPQLLYIARSSQTVSRFKFSEILYASRGRQSTIALELRTIFDPA
jgi:hypothetical protein